MDKYISMWVSKEASGPEDTEDGSQISFKNFCDDKIIKKTRLELKVLSLRKLLTLR